MVPKQHRNNLVWMDMEMTGLDPKKERIIEIATIITDSDLNILEEGPNFVIHQSPRFLKAMDAWNKKQHKESGLIDRVKASRLMVKEAEDETLAFVKEYCYPKKTPLCGSSIHQDRLFLTRYMPKLNDYLHYRHIDVSTVKGLVARWYPKDKNLPKKSDCHRALSDIRESIEELRYYKKNYFK